jgi:inward rectifier potassium channel
LSSKPHRRPRSRLVTLPGRKTVEILGASSPGARDLYHLLIGAPWWSVLLGTAVIFLVINTGFAVAYLLTDGISGARRGSFWDAFFFSVQTMGTIGYGTMSPANFAANVLVTLESMVGLLGLAMVTGLVFSKFSRPVARVMFSKVAVITHRDGVPTLMLRVANERANHIVEAQLRLALLRNERTLEGEWVRRIQDLSLVRSQSPAFTLSWTVLHPILPNSPLYGATAQKMAEQEYEIIVTLTGIDETLSQNIHARHSYQAGEIVWNARFADVLTILPDGRRQLNYAKFHEVIPAEPAAQQ